MQKQPGALATLLLALVVAVAGERASAGPLTEYEVKAAFLQAFVKFADWPDSTYATDADSVVIGILGEDPFGGALQRLAKESSPHARPVVVRTFPTMQDLAQCHVLFIGSSKARHARDALSRVKGRPVLTVGELDGFLQSGGMVNFFLREKRVKFEVNLAAVQGSGIVLRSQVLRIAANVVARPE